MSDETPSVRSGGPSLALRRARARRAGIVLGCLVGLPTIAAVVYYAGLATPEYESVTVLAVESGEPPEEPTRSAARSKHAMADRDLQVARDYALSREVFAALDEGHRFRAHYRAADLFSRLARDAGSEEGFEYYRSRVSIVSQTQSATMELRVRAFSARQAHDFAKAVVEATARFLDRRSDRVRHQALERAERSVTEARERLSRVAGGAFESEIARQEVAAALRAREMVEVESTKRQRSLWVVAGPSTPDRPSYPRRGWSIATVFVGSLVGTGILWLLGAAVREHSRFS